MHQSNILQLIKDRKGKFTQQQGKIATYLLSNQENAAFLTATELATEIGVSQPTVIRFAQSLGFSRYSVFIQAFQALIKEELTSTDRLNLSLSRGKSNKSNQLSIISGEMKTLGSLANSFPIKQFQRLVKQICSSEKVYIIGTRGSASLAHFFSYFLGKVKRNVDSLTSGATKNYDRLLHLGAKDLVVAIAFPRYPRETIDLAAFCRQREISLVGITDKVNSPLAELSNYSIVIPITFSTIFDSYCSAFCLFNMVVTDVGRLNRRESAELSNEFERLARQTKIFT